MAWIQMTRNQKLMLVEIKEIEVLDKETGDKLKKFKYVFFNDANEPVVGYADKKVFAERIRPAEKFSESESFTYAINGTLWEGVINWRVVVA